MLNISQISQYYLEIVQRPSALALLKLAINYMSVSLKDLDFVVRYNNERILTLSCALNQYEC